MLKRRSNNNIIRNLHERCLRLIYNDENSSYDEFLTIKMAQYTSQKYAGFGNQIAQN